MNVLWRDLKDTLDVAVAAVVAVSSELVKESSVAVELKGVITRSLY